MNGPSWSWSPARSRDFGQMPVFPAVADTARGCSIGQQQRTVPVQADLFETLCPTLKHAKWRHGGMVQVHQILGDRELVPIVFPEWFGCGRHSAGLLIETHNHHYTYKG